MAGPYNVKTKSRTIPEFSFKDNVGQVHPVYWQLEEGRVYFRAVDIWQAVTKSSGHFSKSHLRLTEHEAKRLKEYKFPASPATRKVCALSISLALTVCERLTTTAVPTEVEKWIRDQVCPAVGEAVSSSAAAMLARAKKKTAQIVKSPSPPPGKIKKTPLVPPDKATPDLFTPPAPVPNPLTPEEQHAILTQPAPTPTPRDLVAEAELTARAAPLTAMLRAELDDETLTYELLFPDAPAEDAQFHGQGYALPPVSPVPGQVLWPERLGVSCDDLDQLFALTAEEAARLEPCLWMHKSADGSQRRVIDQTGWAKMLGFASVKANPDQHKAVTALFEGAALVFAARKPEADPGCITVISSPSGSTVAVSEPAKPKSPEAPAYPANAPQPDIAQPAPAKPVSPNSSAPMPGRKLSYWSLHSHSVPVRAAQDGLGSLWIAKVDLERIVGEEGNWPYDVRDMPSGKIMHDTKIYTAICEKAVPLIVAGASNGTKTEGLKFAKWWAETVQAAFGQTKPINQVWPVPGERVVSPIMQARPISYVYNGRLIGKIWVAEDAVGGLWVSRASLELVFGGLQSWPMTVRQAARSIIELEGEKYPALNEDIIDDLVKAGKIAVSRDMALDFADWFSKDVAPKFGANAPATPKSPAPGPKSTMPPLEGELMDFYFKGVKYEVIVAVDNDDDIWAEIGPLEKVFGAEARDWPSATHKALIRDIAFKGGVKPAVQEKWIEVIAGCSPFRPRADAFTNWWLAEVMPFFDTTDPEPAPAPAPVKAEPEPEDAEFVEVLDAKPATFFLPISIKTQEVSNSMSHQARELAKLLSSMADALDNKDRENAELRALLAEREEDHKKLQAIQAALGLK